MRWGLKLWDRKVFEAHFTEMTLAMVWGIDSVQGSFTKSSIQHGLSEDVVIERVGFCEMTLQN